LKTQAITLMKEDILSLGRMVSSSVGELVRLLNRDPSAKLSVVEETEEKINAQCLRIEEKCLDLLTERSDLQPQEIRTLVGSTLLAAKFERLADHANRVAKYVTWASAEEDSLQIPPELAEMAQSVHRMVEDTLVIYLSDDVDRVPELVQRDAHINYLHDVLSKKLLSDLGVQDQEEAQTRTQFLFCARYIERMGDCCISAAKRTHFIVTGKRLKSEN
jgi:phosphate transport system protein